MSVGVCGFSILSQPSGHGCGLALWHHIVFKHHVGMSVEVCSWNVCQGFQGGKIGF